MNDETIEERVMAEHLGDYRRPVIDFLHAWPLRRWVFDLMAAEARSDETGEQFSLDEAEMMYCLLVDYFPKTLERIEARWKRSLP